MTYIFLIFISSQNVIKKEVHGRDDLLHSLQTSATQKNYKTFIFTNIP